MFAYNGNNKIVETTLLKEVFDEISRLEHETQNLRSDATSQLEREWHTYKSHLAPIFEAWTNSICANSVATYAIFNATAMYIAALSQTSANNSAQTFFLDRENELFSSKNDRNLLRQIRLSVGCLDMHMDFDNKKIVVPLIIADTACGVAIADVPTLKKEYYATIVHSTSTFLDHFRTSVFSAASNQITQASAS